MFTPDFFRSRIDAMIHLNDPLAVLATRLSWAQPPAAKRLLDRASPPLAATREPPAVKGDSYRAQTLDLLEKVMSGEVSAKDAAEMLEFATSRPQRGNPAGRKGLSAEVVQSMREALGIHYPFTTKTPPRSPKPPAAQTPRKSCG